MVRTRNVAGSARTGAAAVERLVHRLQHCGMLAHSQIVVRAPHGDLAGTALMMVLGARKRTGLALQIGEHPIAPFAVKAFDLAAEIGFVIHGVLPLIVAAGSAPMLSAGARSLVACCSRNLWRN